MWRHLSQQPTFDEQAQIVVDGGERNGWNTSPHRIINVFRRMVAVRGGHGLVDHLPLMCDRQPMLGSQFTELFMGGAHKLSNKNHYKLFPARLNRCCCLLTPQISLLQS